MKVHKIYPRGFASNCYLLTEDGVDAVAIDPGQPRIAEEASRLGLTVRFILLTHGHFDHIGGCAALQRTGAKVGCCEGEKALVLGPDNMGEAFGMPPAPFSVDFTFHGGDRLTLLGMDFDVLATPGHTAGGVTFRVGDVLFTGDTLFAGDVGRVDLPTGSGRALRESVKGLFALAGEYAVCPGHGEDSTLSHERTYNGGIVC